MHRRVWIAALLASILTLSLLGCAKPTGPVTETKPASASAPAPAPAGTGKLVIVGWGGSYQEAQDKAFYSPFAKAASVAVTQDTGPQIERSKAEVESGKPAFD